MKVSIQLILVVVVVIAGVVAFIFRDQLSGSAGDLQVGDCFEQPTTLGEVKDVQHKPCNQPHNGEIYVVFDYPNPPESYPTDTDFQTVIAAECIDKNFETYTGIKYDSDEAGDIDIGWFTPTQEGWGRDKEISCWLRPLDDQPISNSYKAGSN